MNIFYLKLKTVLFVSFLILSVPVISDACVSVNSVFIVNEVDNLDGTCTYDVSIVLTNVTTAIRADISVNSGTISNCAAGSCSDVTIAPGAAISATITKGCGEDIKILLDGYDTNGMICGQGSFTFTGLEPLPVELMGFKSIQDERSNTLLWETASEENALAFQVQRSLDGINDFESIGRVMASGYSTSVKSYNFVDNDPLSLAYYRLKMIDYDGSFEFSEVLAVERAKTEIDLVEVFPIPAVSNEVTVLVHSKKEGPVFIDLFDMTGRSIRQDRIDLKSGVNRLIVDWDSNEGNVYFLTIYNGTERISKKILKSNLD